MKHLVHEGGQASGTKVMYTVGMLAVLFKVIVSGGTFDFGGIIFSYGAEDYTGLALIIAALGAQLGVKKHFDVKKNGSAP